MARKKSPGSPTPELVLYNQRMMEFLRFVAKERVQGYKSVSMALAAIGFLPNNIHQITTTATQSFQPEHFLKAVEIFGADANYFFNSSHTKMMKETEPKPVMVELREVVARLALELNKK